MKDVVSRFHKGCKDDLMMTTTYLLGDDPTQEIFFMEAVEQWKKWGFTSN